MVLKRLFSFLVLTAAALSVAGCPVPRQSVVRAPQSMEVAVAAVMAYPDRRDVGPVPDNLLAGLDSVLAEHNLSSHHMEGAALYQAFETQRTPPHRLGYMGEQEPAAPLLLLIEAEPQFYSQLSGRYRWTVAVRITLAPREHIEEAYSSEVAIPVFLEFYHEKEPEAVRAAAPLVERQVGFLLDEYLGGLGGAVAPGHGG